MLSVGGLSGPIGRAFLLVGIIGAFFGLFAAVLGTRQSDEKVMRLVPRFAFLSCAAAIAAFAAMEWGMITRDFSLAYVQKWARTVRLRCTTSPQCGVH